MKLTENDVRYFQQLSKTETGRYLADYYKRVIDYVHDSRGWDEGVTRESAGQAGKLIQELLLDKIRPGQADRKGVNQFE